MHFVKHLHIFIKNNFKQLRRKWLTLPLILLFPLFLIGMVAVILIAFFIPNENHPIKIGLVNLDQTKETELVVNLIEDSSQLGNYLHIHQMSQAEAITAIAEDDISSYIVFPDEFTNKLYTGQSVQLPIIGNPKQPMKSQLIKELIDSIARHITASQANILTINYYAKELAIDSETRNDMLFEQFKDFLLYTMGKDQVVTEKEILNAVTSYPIHYYSIACWFILLTVWLFSIYHLLYQDEALRMKQRMKLYGVTELQQIIAKLIVTLMSTAILAILSFLCLHFILDKQFSNDDYIRIVTITLLYAMIYLALIAIIELIISSQKIRILIQSTITGILLLVSGAVIPTIYFPLTIQNMGTYIFSFETFHWLQELLIHERLYADYVPSLLTAIAGFFMLIGCAIWKERLNR